MRFHLLLLALLIVSHNARAQDDIPITPIVELQSSPLTGMELQESPRTIYQIRLMVDAKQDRGTLILDGNIPEFDEFGKLVGGVQSPHVGTTGKAGLVTELPCTIELLKKGPDNWWLYSIKGPKINSKIRVATKRSLAAAGLTRLIVLGPKDKVRMVVDCTCFGLAVP